MSSESDYYKKHPEEMKEYDILYQKWLTAKRAGDYKEADKLRDRFEYLHALTIYAEGEMVILGETVREMEVSKWQKKFRGKASQASLDYESRFGFVGATHMFRRLP